MKGIMARKDIRAEFGRAAKEEHGQNLVEFALVITVVLMMIFGIIDFGRALYTYHFVAHAAREGSRYAMVRGADCQLTNCTEGDIQNYVKSLANGNGLDLSAMADPQVSWSEGSSSDASCPTDHNPGCVVQVQVSYNFKFIFPLLPTLTYPMTSTSQMVISQ
jgi:Flp pilus assembly protein TadG